jgi:hypothetical protein
MDSRAFAICLPTMFALSYWKGGADAAILVTAFGAGWYSAWSP